MLFSSKLFFVLPSVSIPPPSPHQLTRSVIFTIFQYFPPKLMQVRSEGGQTKKKRRINGYGTWCHVPKLVRIYVQHQTPFHIVVHQVVYHFVMFVGACACITCPLFWRIGHSRSAVLCLWKM